MIISRDAETTMLVGKNFSAGLKGGEVIVFAGELGGGKTTFIKGLLAGLGYKKRVASPSYTLVNIYKRAKLLVCHCDLYRIESSDIYSIGLADYLYAFDSLTLIEWGEKCEHLLDKYIKITFSYETESKRKIKLLFNGYTRAEQVILKGCFTV